MLILNRWWNVRRSIHKRMKDWRLFICQCRIISPDFPVSELSYRVPCSSHLCPLSSKHILCDQHICGPTGHAYPLLENHVAHSSNKDTENYYNVYLQNCSDVSWPLKHFSQIKSFLISTYYLKLLLPKMTEKGRRKIWISVWFPIRLSKKT